MWSLNLEAHKNRVHQSMESYRWDPLSWLSGCSKKYQLQTCTMYSPSEQLATVLGLLFCRYWRSQAPALLFKENRAFARWKFPGPLIQCDFESCFKVEHSLCCANNIILNIAPSRDMPLWKGPSNGAAHSLSHITDVRNIGNFPSRFRKFIPWYYQYDQMNQSDWLIDNIFTVWVHFLY